MDLSQVIGIGLITVFLTVLMKQYHPSLALAMPILGTVVIFLIMAPYLRSVIEMLQNLSEQTGIAYYYIEVVIKMTGIAYVCQFAAELCRDAGEGSMAGKIEFAGKLMILTLSMPIVYQLLDVVSSIIRM